MSVAAAIATGTAGRLSTVRRAVAGHWALVAGMALATLAGSIVLQLVALVVRFGNLPNYATLYDWPGNVATIVASTPSVRDMLPIIAGEWLVEIGYMNYDYGLGISEWAFTLIPLSMLAVAFTGALLGTLLAVWRETRSCPREVRAGSAAAGGLGATFVALTSLTMSWVVCCATPSWVVGLAMMGLGVSTSLWLQPIGGWVALTGFALIALAILWAAGPARPADGGEVRPAQARPITRVPT